MEWSQTLSTILSIIFFFIMIAVIYAQFRKRKSADKDKTLEEFDGIIEKDAPIPRILFVGYFLGFAGAIVYVLLFPGFATWGGFLDWQPKDDAYVGSPVNLDAKIDSLVVGKTDKQVFESLIAQEDIVSNGKALFGENCGACHGRSGDGQHNFPVLSDDDWLYGGSPMDIYTTIHNGREGRMPAWRDVLTEDEIDSLTDYVSNLNSDNFVVNESFDNNCSSCHGEDAKGNQGVGAPNLTDNVWLHGGSKEDIRKNITQGINNQMPDFGERLTRNQIMSLTTYIMSLQTDAETQIASDEDDSYLLSRNEKPLPSSVSACTSCHGKEGNSVVPGAPNLAGLKFEYIYNQIHLFDNGNRDNATMKSMVTHLSAQDRVLVAKYYASLTPPELENHHPEIPADGVISDPTERMIYQGDWKRAIPACTTCHGEKLEGSASFPRLAGQSSEYLVEQFNNWRSGARKGDQGEMMYNVAKKLSSKEIEDLSNYLSELK
ncbi:c-type cytochrome [Vibrio sp. TBV020]|uniref:c-type cytochrome n=1 Tax=Vibrio sp. TBV020 TaxID=3137398 RepID=UPI0038CDC4A8